MRLKKFLITFGCCLLLTQSFAQFPFNQKDITDGNINCTVITTTTKTVDSKIVSKTRTSRIFSSAIKVVFLKDDSALRLYNFKKSPQKRLPNLAISDNFSRTLNELETKGLAKIPRYQLLKLDTGQLFEYVRTRKNISFKTFSFSGAFQSQISNKSTKVVEQTTEECQVVLNIGTFQNDLLISTSGQDDYHSWLPQAQESSGRIHQTAVRRNQ
jgi:hypothetical protein